MAFLCSLPQECNHDDVGRVFANVDAVHVMSYAILMLNTDLHNNQVKKKMTLEVSVSVSSSVSIDNNVSVNISVNVSV